MAFGFSSGTVPIRTNPKWVLWFKRAQQVQTGNNAPLQQNTRRQLIQKILNSINNR